MLYWTFNAWNNGTTSITTSKITKNENGESVGHLDIT